MILHASRAAVVLLPLVIVAGYNRKPHHCVRLHAMKLRMPTPTPKPPDAPPQYWRVRSTLDTRCKRRVRSKTTGDHAPTLARSLNISLTSSLVDPYILNNLNRTPSNSLPFSPNSIDPLSAIVALPVILIWNLRLISALSAPAFLLVDMDTKSATTSTVSNSVDSSSSSDSSTDSFPSSDWGANFPLIIVIKLNERNYSPWTKSVKVYLLAKGQAKYVTDDPLDKKYPFHILRAKELPSLGEFFSRLCQATLTHVASSLAKPSVLAASMGPYWSLGMGLAEVAVLMVVVAVVEGVVRGVLTTTKRIILVIVVKIFHSRFVAHQASISVFADSMVSIYAKEDQCLFAATELFSSRGRRLVAGYYFDADIALFVAF
ncbi:hypothetical protein Acr_25g0001820 [Actinidia rufa]|uniref:Retrotransposon Copia-like N-terminal domain-containing protein n=1 Tax=Actinidia rufa TaxID=165716 RepID=A0A7J0GY75_9ERIC|nr:hypothetical protein Acr_25g0001820 [Actinidia rufa]